MQLTRSEHAQVFNRAALVPSAIAATLVVGLVCSPWGERTTGCRHVWILAISAVWLACEALFTLGVSYERYIASRALRTFEALRAIAFCSVFGAASVSPASPAYVLALVASSSGGLLLLHRNPVVVVAAFVMPVLIRALAIGDGLLVAAGVGVMCGATLLLTGRQHERDHLLREAFDEESRRLAARRDAAGGLAAAMALHDGLSGAVLVLQTRLATVTELDGTLLARFAQRARSVLSAGADRGVEALDELLRHGCRLEIAVAAAQLPIDEQRDIADIGWETAMNASRAGGRDIIVTVEVTDEIVRVRCDAQNVSEARSGGGRGLRYAQLRTAWRGGAIRFTKDTTSHFEAYWPRRTKPPRTTTRFELFETGLILVGGGLLALVTSNYGPLWLVLLAGAAELMVFLMTRGNVRKLNDSVRTLERAALDFDAHYARIGAGLTAALSAIEHAADLPSARDAVNAFADALSSAMAFLEDERRSATSGDQVALPAV